MPFVVTQDRPRTLGAEYLGQNRCRFRVWAPELAPIELRLLKGDRRIPLEQTSRGYHEVLITDVEPGERYFFRLRPDKDRPDPASRLQPDGVHGPSQIVPRDFAWRDEGWQGLRIEDYIIYELHVGLFTAVGTFAAIISQLDHLAELGITALELMPVAQFPGRRNWGYDGVFPFAAQNSYGGPAGLKKLVDACHRRGLAVILDVVYNHLGPEGNYFTEFGPYFTDRYQTPWGRALNFDGPESDEVRNFFIQNALQWIGEFHVDALRLDAVHAILDRSPITFLEHLVQAVKGEAARLDRRIYLIAESADNNARLVRERARGGYGLDAQWNDDFHHCLRTLLTGERDGYYCDYGEFPQLLKAYREGFVYSGEYSEFRRRSHGSSSRDIPPRGFIVFAQNHDQVGNRCLGDRLSGSVTLEDLKLAAGLTLLSPYIPLLFMGEEYAEEAPFPYFIDHSDRELIEAVRRGRQLEFDSFAWHGEVPDPQAEATFLGAKLRPKLRAEGHHKILLEFYRTLIKFRKNLAALRRLDKDSMKVVAYENEKILAIERWDGADRILLIANLNTAPQTASIEGFGGGWRKILDSADEKWRGPGSLTENDFACARGSRISLAPRSFALFHCQRTSL
jgi:maltooligosyltrehalose trehalohydrolase